MPAVIPAPHSEIMLFHENAAELRVHCGVVGRLGNRIQECFRRSLPIFLRDQD